MATLHKFKLLATQCAVAGSPGRSPSRSPVVHLRRRKTLRMLLNRSSATHRRRFHLDQDDPPLPPPPPQPHQAPATSNSAGKKKSSRKLKELFVSSPPFEERERNGNGNGNNKSRDCEEETEDFVPVTVSSGDGFSSRGSNSLRTVTASFRYRLLRRAWRPMLVTIPE